MAKLNNDQSTRLKNLQALQKVKGPSALNPNQQREMTNLQRVSQGHTTISAKNFPAFQQKQLQPKLAPVAPTPFENGQAVHPPTYGSGAPAQDPSQAPQPDPNAQQQQFLPPQPQDPNAQQQLAPPPNLQYGGMGNESFADPLKVQQMNQMQPNASQNGAALNTAAYNQMGAAQQQQALSYATNQLAQPHRQNVSAAGLPQQQAAPQQGQVNRQAY